MEKKRSVGKIIVSRILGLLFFFVLIIVLSFLASKFRGEYLISFLSLLVSNIILVSVMILLFVFAEIFSLLKFPFNIPNPLFNAPASALLADFSLKILRFVGEITEIEFLRFFSPAVQNSILFAVFWLTFILGYVNILANHLGDKNSKKKESEESSDGRDNSEEKPRKKKKSRKK